MVKEGKLRLKGDLTFNAIFKGPLVLALCGVLVAQSAVATAQAPSQDAKAAASPATEMSRLQPVEELPSAPVPQTPTQPQQSPPDKQSDQQSNPRTKPQTSQHVARGPDPGREDRMSLGHRGLIHQQPDG